jgi:hypothetical protein
MLGELLVLLLELLELSVDDGGGGWTTVEVDEGDGEKRPAVELAGAASDCEDKVDMVNDSA